MWSDQEKVIKYPFDVSRVSVCFCWAALYRAVFRPKWWNRRPCLGGCAARHCLVLSLPASRQLQAGSAPGNIHTDPAPQISETVSAVREWHAVRQYGVPAACGVERVVRSDRVGACDIVEWSCDAAEQSEHPPASSAFPGNRAKQYR